MAQRQTYRRHVPWNTKSNKVRLVKTPGGRLVYQHIQKKAAHVKCGDTKKKIIGVKRCRPMQNARLKKRQRRVTRAYGGSLCAGTVKTRIVRAFLVEEQRCVKQVLQEKEKLEKEVTAPAKESKKSKKKKN